MDVAAILHGVPFFSHLSQEQLAGLVDHGKVVACQQGEAVVHEGDAADSMYVILDGKVRVFKSDAADNEIDIATLGTGNFFGELALLDQGTRSATVVCLVSCQFFVLDQPAFLTLLTVSDSSAIQRLMAALAQRVRDTSERVFREELARHTLEATMEIERLRSLSQMVAGVAHEINTPLGIINTAANMIEKRLSSEDVTALLAAGKRASVLHEEMLEASRLIQGNIARAHRLVQDFKKISVHQVTDTRESINLPELVRSIVDLFKINAKKAHLDISIANNLSKGEQIWTGYPGYLTQVLMNLLTNIERYAYPEGKGGLIEITLQERQDGKEPGYNLIVQDHGVGISPENLPRVFDPFFTTGRSKGGTGLGMAIVYNIVTSALHGSVEVTSEVGKGTTVMVEMPQTVPETAGAA